ncbi:MAG: hypothetical protein ACI9WU_004450 [Myxococcota bacterium]|jgi:hypothetical protein
MPNHYISQHSLVALIALALLVWTGCEANEGSSDVTESPTEQDVSPEEIAGCEWVDGDWDFVACNEQTALVQLKREGCELDLESSSEIYNQGVGQVRDAGVFFELPTGDQCHGFYDGTELSGACGSLLTICAFTATPH